MPQVYRLAKRFYPYVPRLQNYGTGCIIPHPEFSLLSVGYIRDKKHPGNVHLPDKHKGPDGGRWEILKIWQTGWMSIRSLITGQVIFSVPPGTLEPIN